jgi:FK506-binding nuclear protein
MVVAVALWSIALAPGVTESIIPQSDLRITNVALGDQLVDESGRTSVKFTYNTPIKMDEDDDDDKDAPEPLSTTVLCSLTPGKIEQATVDLILEEDEEFLFEVVGKNTVYLTGNYIDQTPPDNAPFGDDSGEDDDEEAFDLREVSSDVEINPDELDSDDEGRFEEVVEEDDQKSLKRPRDSDAMETDEVNLSKKQHKKLKAQDGKAVATEKPEEKKEKTDKTEKKEEKKEKKEKKKKDKKEQGSDEKKDTSTTKELPSGIKIKDVKVGTGPQAKKGNTVSMRYIGKLQNGNVFDSNTKGKPFTFHLGKGEVIKGWDEGIAGMQAGGERLLTIPPNMGYGNKAIEGIPAKSTLIFECKLVQIK